MRRFRLCGRPCGLRQDASHCRRRRPGHDAATRPDPHLCRRECASPQDARAQSPEQRLLRRYHRELGAEVVSLHMPVLRTGLSSDRRESSGRRSTVPAARCSTIPSFAVSSAPPTAACMSTNTRIARPPSTSSCSSLRATCRAASSVIPCRPYSTSKMRVRSTGMVRSQPTLSVFDLPAFFGPPITGEQRQSAWLSRSRVLLGQREPASPASAHRYPSQHGAAL